MTEASPTSTRWTRIVGVWDMTMFQPLDFVNFGVRATIIWLLRDYIAVQATYLRFLLRG
jgi:hypothetical protein